MNEKKYMKESYNLNHSVQQLLDFLDRVRENLNPNDLLPGNYTIDAMDKFKQNFYRLSQKVSSHQVTFDFLYLTNEFFNKIKNEMFDSDPTVAYILDEVERSLNRLYHISNEEEDEYYKESDEDDEIS